MTSVLVTGGAGYIGSHVVLALEARGHSVVVLDNLSTGVRQAVSEGTPFYVGDVADRELVTQVVSRHDINAVMHFAGSIVVPESVVDPTKYYRNNTSASLALIEACVAAKIEPFVFSSTAAVYGAGGRSRVREDDPTNPINPYGASKLMVERMLFDTAAAHSGFRPICLRYFNVAGADPLGRAGQRTSNATHLIQLAVETALGLRPYLEIFGEDYPTRDGTCERDYIHVADLATVHVAALDYLKEGGPPEVLNCGYGSGLSVRDVIDSLDGILGAKIPTRSAPRRIGDPAALVASPDKLRSLLRWSPAHSDIQDIISSALTWRRQMVGPAG